jgi:hypothetical protein
MRQNAPTTAAPPCGGAAQHEQEFVYYDGEHPGWRISDGLDEQQANARATTTSSAPYMPLTMMQHAASLDTLHEVHIKVARLSRAEVIRRYRAAYAAGKRLIAGVMAANLVERGIPPCFWHEMLAFDDATLDQRADLVLTDLAWLRRWYPKHAAAVRYRRGKALLTGSDATFRREAKFAFYQGKRPAWKLVGSMSMTERQQWDCAYLRSTPVKRLAAVTETLSCRVRQVIIDDLQAARRTVAFTDADAHASVARRFALWRCARMVEDVSPTEIATRYQQMTGTTITRQVAAKQLQKVQAALTAKGNDFLR